MKIGIITQPLSRNYGGILQNYALQQTLIKLGHIPYTYDLGKYTWKDWVITNIKNLIKKIIGRPYAFFETPKKRKQNEQCLRKFVEGHINLILPRSHRPTSNKVLEYKLNALIVGSDQIWRPKYNSSIRDMYLNFAKNLDIKRIAYAASFGTGEWEYTLRQTSLCKSLLQKFDAVSVREDSAVKLCKKNFNVNAVHVVDPTLLLSAEEYKRLLTHIPETKSHYIFAYILDQSKEKTEIIMEIAKRKNLSVKFVYEPIQDIINNKFEIHTEDWLKYYNDAKYIITDSFHGVCIALKFKKQFLFFMNEYRGASRFNTLIKDFGIGDRIISSANNIDEKLNSDIDYSVLNEKMQNRVAESLDILKTMLNGRKNKTISDYDIIVEKEISLINKINSVPISKQVDTKLNHIEKYLKYAKKENFYRFKYLGYRFIQNFCFGKARQNIGLKKTKYKEIVKFIDTF